MIKAISVSGPSGIGKATICKSLIKLWPNFFAMVSSGTTREGKLEVHGKKYKLFSHKDFEAHITANKFLEYNKYPTQNGFNYYGSLRESYEEITASEKIALLDIDINGVKQAKEELGDSLLSICLNCEIEEIEIRLRNRKSEDEQQIQVRVQTGKFELKQIPELKAAGIIDKVVWYGKSSLPEVTANEIYNFLPKKQAPV